MWLVIAQQQFLEDGELKAGDFDFENPVATYPEQDHEAASLHAETYAQNQGVATMVVHEENLEELKKAMTRYFPCKEPRINVWNKGPQGILN